MALRLVLISHLERLGPSYVPAATPGGTDPEWTYFWMGLSGGYDDPNTGAPVIGLNDAQRLRTWLWTGWKSLVAAGLAAGSNTPVAIAAADVQIVPLPNGLISANVNGRFSHDLQARFDKSVAQAVNYSNFGVGLPQVLDRTDTPWHTFLGGTSAWPAGLNVWMKTTVHLKIRTAALAGLNEVIVAPVFAAGTPFAADRGPTALAAVPVPMSNAASPVVVVAASSPQQYVWTYDPGEVAMVCRQAQCLTALPVNTDPSVDLQTLEPNNTNLALPENMPDWTHQLENTLSGLFDLPRLLLIVLRNRTAANEALPRDANFEAFFLAALRDTANLGRAVTPDGSRLSDWLLTRLQRAGGDALLAAKDTPDFITWTTLLRDILQQVQKRSDYVITTVQNGITTWSFTFQSGNLTADDYLIALEQLQNWTAQQDFLAALLSSQYSAALSLSSAGSSGIMKTLSDALAERNLRQTMLLGALGPAWRSLKFQDQKSFTDAVLGKPKVSGQGGAPDMPAVPGAVENYIRARYQSPANSLYPQYPVPSPQGLSATELDALVAEMVAVAGDLMKSNVLPVAVSGARPAVTAESLMIPVGGFRSEPDAGSKEDRADSQRSVSGAGIFIKLDNDTDPWTMLNYANVVDLDGKLLLSQPVPVPLHVKYARRVATAFQSYKNQPLATQSPEQGAMTFNERSTSVTDPDALFTLANAYTSDPGAPGLKGLAYGKTYRTWVYHFGHGGNLPASLTASGSADNIPYQLVFPQPSDLKSGASLGLEFTRQTGIGQVRLMLPGRQDLHLPDIADGVLTMMESRSQETAQGPVAGTDKPSLVLLVPGMTDPKNPAGTIPADGWNANASCSEFSFEVYPPAVDRDIWQRWKLADDTSGKLREFVREQWLKANLMADKTHAPDVTLDDPAVSVIELVAERVFAMGKADVTSPVVQQFSISRQSDPANPSMKDVQAGPCKLKIVSAPAGTTMKLVPSGDTWSILIPEGELWSLRFRPRVQGKDLNKFEKPLQDYVRADQTDYTVPALGEVRLYAEVASTWEGTVEDNCTALHNALQPSFDEAAGVMTTRFNPTGKLSLLLQRTTLEVQRWRWNGRPLPPRTDAQGALLTGYGYPLIDAASADPDPMDGVLFGDRESNDRYELNANVDFAAPAPTAVFPAGDPPPDRTLLERRDLSNLPGALYFRYALRVDSRYKPLLNDHGTLETRVVTDRKTNAQNERWQRVEAKCRFRGDLPAPSLHLVVPLTQAIAVGSDLVPNRLQLLVILNDQWRRDDMAGLADMLEGEIVRVGAPDAQTITLPQFGPDPIVSMDPNPTAGMDVVADPPLGPIGLTFDTDTNAALFSRTCFLQTAPACTDDDGNPLDLSWYFLQLRYRRRLDDFGLAKSLAGSPRTSPWTAPTWAQLLPPANRFRVQVDNEVNFVQTTDLTFNPKTGFVGRASSSKDVILPTKSVSDETSQDPAAFTLYALVTRVAPDAFGRTGAESYVLLCPLDTATLAAQITPYLGAGPENLQLRLVEIQHRRGQLFDVKGHPSIFDGLFPIDATTSKPSFTNDALARIVRVSLPIIGVN